MDLNQTSGHDDLVNQVEGSPVPEQISTVVPGTSSIQNSHGGQSGKAIASDFDIQTFEATRSIVTRQAERLDELKKEIKIHNEQLKNILENDKQLVIFTEETKQSGQKSRSRRNELMETTEARALKLKLGDLKEERGDLEDSISNHLFDLYQTTGVMEFEDLNGNVWEFDIRARLKTKKSV